MSRRDIYYWKCDRPAAFHNTAIRGGDAGEIARQLADALRAHFYAREVSVKPGAGQGNHLTFEADVDGAAMFVRVENGPEKDGHLEIESRIAEMVRATGVPVPKVLGCDASRTTVPFAWQALELVAAADLNQCLKRGELDEARIAFDIGAAVARWQALRFPGFGVLEADTDGALRGGHARYADYYNLQLARHLSFLVERQFLSGDERREIEREIAGHNGLFEHAGGCFVHKDLALWNVLGTRDRIAAFIDFDDSIAGDEMDDLSLLACFHDAGFVGRAIEGYRSMRPLPAEHERRLWLHLARNMIVKAVIRVGSGYFDRDDGFFLIAAGGSGRSLKETTRARLSFALRALAEGWPVARLA